jgi:hypothetical protein
MKSLVILFSKQYTMDTKFICYIVLTYVEPFGGSHVQYACLI